MSKILGNIVKVSTILLALSLLVPGGYARADDDTTTAVKTADVLGLGLVTARDAVRVDVHTRGFLNTRTSRVNNPAARIRPVRRRLAPHGSRGCLRGTRG